MVGKKTKLLQLFEKIKLAYNPALNNKYSIYTLLTVYKSKIRVKNNNSASIKQK